MTEVGFDESSLLFERDGIFPKIRRDGIAGWRIGLAAKKTRPRAGIGWAPDPWVSNSPRKLDSWPSLLGAFKGRQEMQKFYKKKNVLVFVTSFSVFVWLDSNIKLLGKKFDHLTWERCHILFGTLSRRLKLIHGKIVSVWARTFAGPGVRSLIIGKVTSRRCWLLHKSRRLRFLHLFGDTLTDISPS